MKHFILMLPVCFLLFMSGCATLPKPLQNIPASKDVSLSQVKSNPQRYMDWSFLWGGQITNCTNAADGTFIEVLYLPLDREGYPSWQDYSQGRFIVKSKNFLDCAIYSKGRYITVAGYFRGMKDGVIDEMPYSFPFLEAQAVYIWKKRPSYHYYPRPSIWLWYGSPRWWFEYGPW